MESKMTDLTIELLPCPFCGEKAVAEGIDGNNIGCSDWDCPASLINCNAEAWNKRPNSCEYTETKCNMHTKD